jgi:hypothetical protein
VVVVVDASSVLEQPKSSAVTNTARMRTAFLLTVVLAPFDRGLMFRLPSEVVAQSIAPLLIGGGYGAFQSV